GADRTHGRRVVCPSALAAVDVGLRLDESDGRVVHPLPVEVLVLLDRLLAARTRPLRGLRAGHPSIALLGGTPPRWTGSLPRGSGGATYITGNSLFHRSNIPLESTSRRAKFLDSPILRL